MSFEAWAGLIEMGFVYAVALGVGIWQVLKMRRELARDRQAREHRQKPGETQVDSQVK